MQLTGGSKGSYSKWPDKVSKATFEVNNRVITHLLHSPAQILLGFEPSGATEKKFPKLKRESLSGAIKRQEDIFPSEDQHFKTVIDFLLRRYEIRREILGRSNRQKDLAAQKHDMGVRAIKDYNHGDLVMLFDHREAGKKLRPTWRGPFVIAGFGGDMGKSYCLRQIEGTAIPRHYHGDTLKPFRLREGYLISEKEERIPILQNIRLGTAAFKLPRNQQSMPGAWTRNE